MPHQQIQEISRNAADSFLHVSRTGAKRIESFTIDCSLLIDYNNIDIRDSLDFKSLFETLKTMTGPCLYYFELTSEHLPSEIIKLIQNYSESENPKATPAIKSKLVNSRFLYVGKVKRLIWGRLIQHLGYFKTPGTQGLQLYYWANQCNMTLKFTVLEFEPQMIELMSVLENEFAKRLQPILGKHK